jgi:hypothetical protein
MRDLGSKKIGIYMNLCKKLYICLNKTNKNL